MMSYRTQAKESRQVPHTVTIGSANHARLKISKERQFAATLEVSEPTWTTAGYSRAEQDDAPSGRYD